MIDYNFTETSLSLNAYCLCLYLLGVLLTTVRALKNRPLNKRERPVYIMLVAVFMLFVITSFINADFFSYQRHIREYNQDSVGYLGILDYIIPIIGKNYIPFRMIVWWGALFIIIRTCKRIALDRFLTVYFLFAMFILAFAYARATLAMAVYFYGLSFLLKPSIKNKYLSYALGFFLILISYSFHRSMAFLIIATPAIFAPLNKKSLLISAIIFPSLVLLLSNIFYSVLDTGSIEDEIIMGKLEGYSDRDLTDELNFKGFVMNWMNYLSIYAMVFLGVYLVLTKKLKSRVHLGFVKISFVVCFVASLFLFIDIPNNIFFYRTLYMAFIPATMFFCFIYRERIMPNRIFYVIIFVRIGYHLVKLSYYVTSYL